MKLKSTLLAAVLAVFAASSSTAFAAEEIHDAPKAEAAKTEKAGTKKPVKKHSHMEEKTNVPLPEPEPHTGKEMPMDRHDHMKEKH